MLNVLYNSKEFPQVPIAVRRKAAWEARQRAARHGVFWLAIGLIVVATLSGSWIARVGFGDKPNGTIGAMLGCALGFWGYGRVLFRIGMPYYRELLSEYDRDARERLR